MIRRASGFSILLLIVVSLCAGCGSPRLVAMHVSDLETGKPIAGATATLFATYENWVGTTHTTRSSTDTTDAHGTATLPSPDPDKRVYAHVEADDYFPERTPVSGSTVRIQLMRKPAATVRIIVPDGYRGLVRLNMEPAEKPPVSGAREYVYHFEPGKPVRIRVPRQLLSISPEQFQAAYASGQRILPAFDRDHDEAPMQVRWRPVSLNHSGEAYTGGVFLIGDKIAHFLAISAENEPVR